MRIACGILLVLGLAAAIAGCWPFEPTSSAGPTTTAVPTLDGGGSPPLSSLPVPGPTRKPGFPSPTREIPPPPD